MSSKSSKLTINGLKITKAKVLDKLELGESLLVEARQEGVAVTQSRKDERVSFSRSECDSIALILEMVLKRIKQGWTTLQICGSNGRSRSIMISRFLAVGFMLVDKEPRVLSMTQIYWCGQLKSMICDLELFICKKKQKTLCHPTLDVIETDSSQAFWFTRSLRKVFFMCRLHRNTRLIVMQDDIVEHKQKIQLDLN